MPRETKKKAVEFHEKVKRQSKSPNGDIIVSETEPAPINTWGFGYKVNENTEEEDPIAKMVNAYHNEKSNDIDTDLVPDDPGCYDAGYHDGYIEAMRYAFKCLGIEVKDF